VHLLALAELYSSLMLIVSISEQHVLYCNVSAVFFGALQAKSPPAC